MTWEDYQKIYGILGQLTKDLKTIMVTKLAHDSKYNAEQTILEIKEFLTHEDYVDALEKMVKYQNGGSKSFYDFCNCGKCAVDAPDKNTRTVCDDDDDRKNYNVFDGLDLINPFYVPDPL